MNILIVKLSALGDVVHTLPALNALRRHHPDAHIAWLIEAAAKELVEGHPALNEVIAWRRRDFEAALKSGRWLTAWRCFAETLRQVRSRTFDLVIDFQGLFKSGVWVGLAKGRRKVGFGRGMERSEGAHLVLTDPVPAISMENHALDRSLHLLRAIDIPPGAVEYRFALDDDTRQRTRLFLEERGLGVADRLVVIHPMTRWPTKLWLEDRFAGVADELTARGVAVVFSGGSADQPALDRIASHMKRSMIRTPPGSGLKSLASLLERATVLVSTDTGPMHLAAAVGTPVVALFGPTSPRRTGPYGEGHVVLGAPVPCSPCFSKRCNTREVEPMACMKRIATTEVIRAVEAIFSRQSAA